jgi:hypothetical protein
MSAAIRVPNCGQHEACSSGAGKREGVAQITHFVRLVGDVTAFQIAGSVLVCSAIGAAVLCAPIRR